MVIRTNKEKIFYDRTLRPIDTNYLWNLMARIIQSDVSSELSNPRPANSTDK